MRDLLLKALALVQDINHEEFSPSVPRAQLDESRSGACDLGMESEAWAASRGCRNTAADGVPGGDFGCCTLRAEHRPAARTNCTYPQEIVALWLKISGALFPGTRGAAVPWGRRAAAGSPHSFWRPREALNSFQAARGELSLVPGMREWKHSLTLAGCPSPLPGDTPGLCSGCTAPARLRHGHRRPQQPLPITLVPIRAHLRRPSPLPQNICWVSRSRGDSQQCHPGSGSAPAALGGPVLSPDGQQRLRPYWPYCLGESKTFPCSVDVLAKGSTLGFVLSSFVLDPFKAGTRNSHLRGSVSIFRLKAACFCSVAVFGLCVVTTAG